MLVLGAESGGAEAGSGAVAVANNGGRDGELFRSGGSASGESGLAAGGRIVIAGGCASAISQWMTRRACMRAYILACGFVVVGL